MDQAAFTASCFSSQGLEATLWFVRKVKFLSEVSSMLVTSVNINLHSRVVWKHTFNLYMKVLSMLVKGATIKLHSGVVWQFIFNLYMNMLNMLVISVTIKLQNRGIWQIIFSQFMKVSSMLVICVINNLQHSVLWLIIFKLNTTSGDQCNHQFTTKSHLKFHIQSVHYGVKYACSKCELWSYKTE